MTAAETAFEKFQANVGETDGTGEWFEMTQERINDFADVTIDHQFIHVDEEAAKASPFGGTIAHGFLTLSMLTHLSSSVPQDPETFKGVVMGVNYGFDKVRFVSPVPSGSKIRATSVLKDVQLKGDNIQVTRTYTIEIEGVDRPAVVADWITRLTYG
ncbi:MAG: MaoC family dehydratase [Acidimicrobiales bacterium]|nr:MaoC family dehydratase [Acidimicrobiales bacterium]